MSEPTDRDELVALLGEHRKYWFEYEGQQHCDPDSCGWVGEDWFAHLADVILAAGWTKADQ